MNKPTLVIMAAGMGSRYGGLKQIDPIGANGEIIMDFSIMDAKKAGFEKAVIVIKKENEQLFKEAVGDRLEKHMKIEYAYQELTNLPEGFCVPEGRVKPWGTGHAVLAAADKIEGPFAVINADDYYGPKAFSIIYDFLTSQAQDGEKQHFCMAGFVLKNTITENGHVARGVCVADENDILTDINERTKIQRNNGIIQYTEDDVNWVDLDENALVSMNCWGFTNAFLDELKIRFVEFLKKSGNELKSEYFLPFVVDELISEGKADVKVLKTDDKWYGVTYKEDKEQVVSAIKAMVDKGMY
ncbi:MAG: nucleotidyltransferase [Ruminococcaceae bacterium]|nr:nucleotidyltransferase [Oscillospiraceae bacterium]